MIMHVYIYVWVLRPWRFWSPAWTWSPLQAQPPYLTSHSCCLPVFSIPSPKYPLTPIPTNQATCQPWWGSSVRDHWPSHLKEDKKNKEMGDKERHGYRILFLKKTKERDSILILRYWDFKFWCFIYIIIYIDIYLIYIYSILYI